MGEYFQPRSSVGRALPTGRRGQRGHVRLDHRTWRLKIRQTDADGNTRFKWIRLGTKDELPTEHAARRAADRLLQQTNPKELHAGLTMHWADWCDRYIDTVLTMHTKGTQATQTSIIRQHLRQAFDCPVHKIEHGMIQAFIYEQKKDGVASSTVAARFALLRRILRQADREGLAVTPPRLSDVTLPRDSTVHETVRRKAFLAAECQSIIRAATPADATAFACALYIGLRASEVLGLAWDLVNLTTGAIEIRQQALDGELRPLKSKDSYAVMQAPPALLEQLRAYREAWTPNAGGFLFADSKGRPETSAELRSRLHAITDSLGLRRRGLHGFRHACALAMADAGRNPEVIRRALRHSSLRITAIYLSAAPEDVARAFAMASESLTSPSHLEAG